MYPYNQTRLSFSILLITEEALKNSWDCITANDLECILCSRCLLDPVTTDCGHTFCRGCLTRVLDHRLSCPLCMAALNVGDYSRGSTVVLQQAIQFLVPKDFKERVSINLKESIILERSSDVCFECKQNKANSYLNFFLDSRFCMY